MRAAVLGGTGFLGSQVVAALHTAGHAVTALTRRPHLVPAEVAIADLGRSWPLRARLTEVLAELAPDVVVNAAGHIWTPSATAHAVSNVELTDQLVAAIPDRPARLVHLGSSLEYGPVEPPAALREDAPTATGQLDSYTRSKLASTRLVLRAADRGLDVVVLRVFNAIGPGVDTASVLGRTAAELLRAHRERDTARIGLLAVEQYRDYVDVRDVAAAVVAAAVALLPAPGPHVVNIGSGHARATAEVVCALAEHTGVPYRVDRHAGARRATGAGWQLADLRRAGRLLGWAPRTPLPKTLAAIWASAAHPLNTAGKANLDD
ncbi:NAD-dependent epimerase/dehydratase family protein [Actinophytocola oryzae]|uniref:Nucleoside-diphosphate-sugar epimerase n=1 Tax=Actinophytocola oryzae TaxID=502181 RepID=A0A4R7VFG0_9PSEU|nr:NAD(P)-dependent oxidoreductase [Actinophytocola oryzae]TDV47962.1 nucleoside-diphosphate-sugar epimerase [Actinophytocola oryzae]